MAEVAPQIEAALRTEGAAKLMADRTAELRSKVEVRFVADDAKILEGLRKRE